MRFSLRLLFAFVFVVSIAIVIVQRYFAAPPYVGLSSDIGDGYGAYHYAEDADGNSLGHFEIEITEQLTAQQPAWEPRSSNPPVSARHALIIADNFRKTRFRDHAIYDWSLSSLNLTPLDIKTNKWCWIVRFEAVPKPGFGGSGIWPEFPVYVMMNGTVIEPKDVGGYLREPYAREP